MSEDKILQMKGISKSYPGVTVFKDFDFDLRRGEIHCICGENGAGKSTLIKMLSGAHSQDDGSIYFEGKKIDNLTPHSAMQMGVQTIYQEHNLFPLLSVVENLFAGNEITRNGIINQSMMIDKTKEILEYLNSSISPFDIVGQLGGGAQKNVEIAKALIQDSKVIILDEPTTSFSQTEIQHLFTIIKKLVQNGISIIYISHRLEEVFEIADRVTIIRDGQLINTYNVGELTEKQLIRDMIGRDVSSFFKREAVEIGEIFFEAKNMSGNGVEEASLYVRKGELLGIAGMVGSGRTELAELLFGVKESISGEIFISGKKVNIKTPMDAILNKICFITEDRQDTGLFLDHTLVQNTVIASYSKSKMPLAFPADDIKTTKKYISQMNVITPSVFQKALFLSGGNQQKVVLAKWFATVCDIFIFDEPTRGIDINATAQIYRIMTQLLKEGKSIIMISSDMLELIAMSDRIMVMRNGLMVKEMEKSEVSEENILQYSIGGYDNE